MRKIITQIQRDKKNKINQLIIGIILIGLLLLSTLGYALGGRDEESSSKKIKYNGVTFIQEDSDYWGFSLAKGEFLTQYNPKETESILFLSDLNLESYFNKPLYLAGGFQEANSEIYRNMNNHVLRIQEACISQKECENNLPIKNCSVDNVIIINELKEDSFENIYQEGNCIFINSGLENQTRYADKFLFKILEI